jgi:hypothetical protein
VKDFRKELIEIFDNDPSFIALLAHNKNLKNMSEFLAGVEVTISVLAARPEIQKKFKEFAEEHSEALKNFLSKLEEANS